MCINFVEREFVYKGIEFWVVDLKIVDLEVLDELLLALGVVEDLVGVEVELSDLLLHTLDHTALGSVLLGQLVVDST